MNNAREHLFEDPWARLRATTPSRIGLGRTGDALPTRHLLEFQLAHARARDAVHSLPEFDRIESELRPLSVLRVHSAAVDRASYLRRPDLGRKLSEESRELLISMRADWDIAFVIADGLSAQAISNHAVATLRAGLQRLEGWRVAPIVLASQARVALGDEIGELLGASLGVVLIGERPGLSVADSLGIYVTWQPRSGRRDSERNCISNIHPEGLSAQEAASKLIWLVNEATKRALTGVQLKEDPTGRQVLDT